MRNLIFILLFVLPVGAFASFAELKTVSELEKLISESSLPIAVAFTASWCAPCQQLKATLKKVEPDYAGKVVVAWADADKNKEFQEHLQKYYPTVRTWYQGDQLMHSFVGSKSESGVRAFLNELLELKEFQACPAPEPVIWSYKGGITTLN